MVDHQFEDPSLAALYDAFCPWEQFGDYDFYLRLVMAADTVLDVGCGTGALLGRARAEGHRGRLCGLDPARGMIDQARRHPDVEWVHGDLGAAPMQAEFDLVIMTGHAFQVFVTDTEIHDALRAIRTALVDDGRFAFETRNPSVRAWERWTPERAVEVTVHGGVRVRMAHEVQEPVVDDVVRFATTYTSASWDRPEVSHSTLRFLDRASLGQRLEAAGLVVEEQYGDWDTSAVSATSPEIITVARAAGPR